MAKITHREESLINYSDSLEDAKVSATNLMKGTMPDADGLFFVTKLSEAEEGIKKLNEFSSKCWLISAIVLYALIYDGEMYKQSGLTWEDYLKDSKSRLGMDSRDMSEQLSSARFFIQHHSALERAGWSPVGNAQKLARAELALALCGSLEETIEHLCNDSWRAFKEWYQNFKQIPVIKNPTENRSDFSYEKGFYKIKGIDAVIINSNLPEEEQNRMNGYMQKIFDALQNGYEPAIIPVYDNKEANTLLRLRDKNRQKK